MRVEVGTVRTISILVLAAAVTACGYGMVVQRDVATGLSSLGVTAPFVATYGLTLLSFAAFPRTRRTDLAKVVVLCAIVAQIAKSLAGHGFNMGQLVAEAVGAFAVLVPSFTERFRSLTRADPHEPFSMVYPNDRRRRAHRTIGRNAPNSASGHVADRDAAVPGR